MNLSELLLKQWEGYPRVHRSRVNLLIHSVAVPLFWAGTLGAVTALLSRVWLLAAVSLAAMALSVVLQGYGHKRERVPPEPFTGPANALSRIVLEQWITFPRFVFSGQWLRAMQR